MNNDTVLDPDQFPMDPKMPNGDILLDIFSRITAMSDAIHHPQGTLQIRLQAQEDLAIRRNMAQMTILRKILAEVMDIKAHLTEVDETVEVHGTQLTLLNKHQEIQ